MSKFWDSFVKRAEPRQEVPEKAGGTFDVFVRELTKEAFYYSWSPTGKIDGRVPAPGVDASWLGKVATVEGVKDRRKLLKAKFLRLGK
jgi:hypothetical protein